MAERVVMFMSLLARILEVMRQLVLQMDCGYFVV